MVWQGWWLGIALLGALPRSACQSGELFVNTHFAERLSPVTGCVRNVDRESDTMLPFPGTATTALQIAAPDRQENCSVARFALTSVVTSQRSGWYRVRFFLTSSVGYNGQEGLVSLQVVGSEGESLWAAHNVKLRGPRAEWLFYDEYVSANTALGVLDGHADAMLSALQVTVDPGNEFSTGSIQLTGLSIEFVEVAERPGLLVIDLCDCAELRTPSGLCGSELSPSCRNVPGCPIAELGDSETYPTSGTCQDDFVSLGGTSVVAAYDGVAVLDSVGWYIAGSVSDVVILQMDIPHAPVAVCAATLTFGQWNYPQRWRLGANSNPNRSYRTWVTAGRVSGATGRIWREASARGATWVSSGGSQISLALDCEDAWNVRLEMEDARGASREMHLIELELQTVSPEWLTCDCRHGGVCTGEGCNCPLATGCSSQECGWTGATCEQPSCVPGIICHNLGACSGPNTCACAPGWHGATGLDQCLEHQCGDGELSEVTGEACDDGNVADGDGCDAHCQLEPLPVGYTRVLSGWTLQSRPRAEIYDESLTLDVLAGTLGVRQEQLRNMELRSIDGEAVVSFELAEVIIQCDRECWHGGSCFTMGWPTDFAPECTCPEPGLDGVRCEGTQCKRTCDHGGYCSRESVCVRCAKGWSGSYCGTADSSFGTVVVSCAGFTIAALVGAAGIFFGRSLQHGGAEISDRKGKTTANSPTMLFAPLAARGVAALLGTCCGGCIWLLMVIVTLRGELFQYESSSNMIRAPMIIFGFGTWNSSILIYLQSMATIHISHRVPLAFFVKLPICLAPWVFACLFESSIAVLVVALLACGYSAFLLATLWPLRTGATIITTSMISVSPTAILCFDIISSIQIRRRLLEFGTTVPTTSHVHSCEIHGL